MPPPQNPPPRNRSPPATPANAASACATVSTAHTAPDASLAALSPPGAAVAPRCGSPAHVVWPALAAPPRPAPPPPPPERPPPSCSCEASGRRARPGDPADRAMRHPAARPAAKASASVWTWGRPAPCCAALPCLASEPCPAACLQPRAVKSFSAAPAHLL